MYGYFSRILIFGAAHVLLVWSGAGGPRVSASAWCVHGFGWLALGAGAGGLYAFACVPHVVRRALSWRGVYVWVWVACAGRRGRGGVVFRHGGFTYGGMGGSFVDVRV